MSYGQPWRRTTAPPCAGPSSAYPTFRAPAPICFTAPKVFALVDCGRTSFRSRGGRRGPQRTEGGAEFGGKECRLLPRGKVTALIELVIVNERRIRLLRPAPRCL